MDSELSTLDVIEPAKATLEPQIDLPLEPTLLGLKYRAGVISDAFRGRIPLPKEMQNITEELGVELATMAFSRILADSTKHGAFQRAIFELGSSDLDDVLETAGNFEVTVIASNLYQSERRWGDHTETWRNWARQLGFKTEVIETSPLASVAANARLIGEFLRANRSAGKGSSPTRRILLSFGQGTAEIRYLLYQMQKGEKSPYKEALEQDVVAWVNVCGAYSGAEASRLTLSHRFERMRHELAMRLKGRNPITLAETSSGYGLWQEPSAVPAQWLTMNLVGLPLVSDLMVKWRQNYRRIAETMPNDGAVGVLQALIPNGLTYAIEGMTCAAEDLKLEQPLKRSLAVAIEVLQATVLASNPATAETAFELIDSERKQKSVAPQSSHPIR